MTSIVLGNSENGHILVVVYDEDNSQIFTCSEDLDSIQQCLWELKEALVPNQKYSDKRECLEIYKTVGSKGCSLESIKAWAYHELGSEIEEDKAKAIYKILYGEDA